jgi:predicted ester cyclase
MKMPRAETEIYTIARRWIECGWQKGQSEVVDELHAPSFVDHNPAGRGSDNHGFKEGIVQLYAAFPDFYARIEDILIDGVQSKATVRWTATGTHRGAFMGCDPTGRVIRFKCIEIIRIAERWGEWNPVELLEQLRSEKRRPRRRADSKRSRRLGSSQSDSSSSGNANVRRILVNGEGASVSSCGSETPPDIFFAKNQIERENEIPALRRRAP